MNTGLTVAQYDPALNVQTSAGALVHSRASSTQLMLASGKLLFTGGNSPIGAITELYDPATATT